MTKLVGRYGIEYVSWWQGLTQSDHCESNKWWIAKRTGIFPEDGSACMYTDPRTVSTPTINSLNPNHGALTLLYKATDRMLGGRKDFAPGTYTFPFSYTLPAPLPGSFEDNDASLVFSNRYLILYLFHINSEQLATAHIGRQEALLHSLHC